MPLRCLRLFHLTEHTSERKHQNRMSSHRLVQAIAHCQTSMSLTGASGIRSQSGEVALISLMLLRSTRHQQASVTGGEPAGIGRSSERGEPRRQAVQEQPSPPRKASQTIDPNDAIPKDKEHDKHRQYPMRKDSIRAVARVLRLLIHVAAASVMIGNARMTRTRAMAISRTRHNFGNHPGSFDRPATTGNDKEMTKTTPATMVSVLPHSASTAELFMTPHSCDSMGDYIDSEHR
jgi:hypothetical protein